MPIQVLCGAGLVQIAGVSKDIHIHILSHGSLSRKQIQGRKFPQYIMRDLKSQTFKTGYYKNTMIYVKADWFLDVEHLQLTPQSARSVNIKKTTFLFNTPSSSSAH